MSPNEKLKRKAFVTIHHLKRIEEALTKKSGQPPGTVNARSHKYPVNEKGNSRQEIYEMMERCGPFGGPDE